MDTLSEKQEMAKVMVYYKSYVEMSTKLLKIIGLLIITKIFFIKVFKQYYHMDIALTQEGVLAGTITVVILSGLMLISKIIWPENVIMKFLSDLVYRLWIGTVGLILITSVGAVLSCGMITTPLLGNFGIITIWKTYWTDSQLIQYCVKELKLQKEIKDVSGINVDRIVIEAENKLDKCKILLGEALEQEKTKSGYYKAWLFWLLGLSWEEGTNKIKLSLWTYGVIGAVGIGLAYAGIRAVEKRNELESINNQIASVVEGMANQRRDFEIFQEGVKKENLSFINVFYVITAAAQRLTEMYANGEIPSLQSISDLSMIFGRISRRLKLRTPGQDAIGVDQAFAPEAPFVPFGGVGHVLGRRELDND